ncbi:MAG: penicillin-insensitive murein endopeptidase [Myxococcales bacterium]|nr:penicillin-insensitive murein endopeptidase [Myxococcales bacterium]MBL0193587.1 penicillin-insensitive murein endopeptidase [Myxococcales bacterium]HQY65596.1 penicillin-insensitive murein endopeptidase [Polyangiaceae bacterium]
MRSARGRHALAVAATAVALASAALGCTPTPTPLAPNQRGSIGLPHKGTLTGGEELPRDAPGIAWLRSNDRHFAVPRLARALARAGKAVAEEHPGAVLCVGDLSAPRGGRISGHASHRTGRDADLLLYLTTLDGAPAPSPGFLPVEADGLAFDPGKKEYFRLDVPRQWALVKALVLDPEANIQWLFVHGNIEALLVAWARARGEPTEVIYRAMKMMLRPRGSGPHDDHVHVRTACLPGELGDGCEPSGPDWPWLHRGAPPPVAPTAELIATLFRDVSEPAARAPSTSVAAP